MEMEWAGWSGGGGRGCLHASDLIKERIRPPANCRSQISHAHRHTHRYAHTDMHTTKPPPEGSSNEPSCSSTTVTYLQVYLKCRVPFILEMRAWKGLIKWWCGRGIGSKHFPWQLENGVIKIKNKMPLQISSHIRNIYLLNYNNLNGAGPRWHDC